MVNPEFSTRGKPIEALVSETLPEAVAGCSARRLHFVTHSLCGIMVRAYLAWAKPENLGHVVMLGPPNKGSEVVDAMQALAAFDWVNGPAGRQLGTDASSFPNRLPRVNFSLGIIAGTVSFNPVYSNFIDGPDDGKVSVREHPCGRDARPFDIACVSQFHDEQPIGHCASISLLKDWSF